MRKKTFLLIVLLFVGLFSYSPLQAQKFGFIDANFILMKMPAYQKAQDEKQVLRKKQKNKLNKNVKKR